MDLMQRRGLIGSKADAGHGLPGEYQEVTYVETTSYTINGEYIETGIYPQDQDALLVKFQRAGDMVGDKIRILGAYSPGIMVDGYRGLRIWTDNPIDFGGGDVNITDGNVHTLVCSDDGTWTYDNRTILIDKGIKTQQTISIVLFKARYTNRVLYGEGRVRIFEFKYYRSGKMIQNLIPCYRKSDGEIGMYDLVTNTFFANAGNGTFTKGADVENA